MTNYNSYNWKFSCYLENTHWSLKMWIRQYRKEEDKDLKRICLEMLRITLIMRNEQAKVLKYLKNRGFEVDQNWQISMF